MGATQMALLAVKDPPPLAIDEKLLRVRRGLMALDSLLAISRTFVAVAPACLILGWLDYTLGFPPALRVLELAALVLAWVESKVNPGKI